MIALIMGGSGSGKSAYAEEYVAKLSRKNETLDRHTNENVPGKYYIATMQVFDKEGLERIERHRNLRAGKGFVTIEQPTSINEALEKMDKATKKVTKEKVALLECMSNLVANEMFVEEKHNSGDATVDKILKEVQQLSDGLENLVIVTNNVFEDGVVYDETTMEYIRAMGSINKRLAAMADEVIEVVVGIPMTIKKGK